MPGGQATTDIVGNPYIVKVPHEVVLWCSWQVYWQNYYAACSPAYCDQTVPSGQQSSALNTAVEVLAMIGGVWALFSLVFKDVLFPLGCLLAHALTAQKERPPAGK